MDDFYSLGFLLSRASVSLAKSMNSELEAHDIDLPHSQYIVLRCLYYKDALSQLEIAHLLSKDAAAIKRTVDHLEEKGLVIRKQVRTLKNSVCITEKGRNILPQALEIGHRLSNVVLDGIKTEDQKLLLSMLDKIYINLEKK